MKRGRERGVAALHACVKCSRTGTQRVQHASHLVDDSGGGGVGLLLKGVHQHHLLVPSQGRQNRHAVQEQLHLTGLILVHLPDMVPEQTHTHTHTHIIILHESCTGTANMLQGPVMYDSSSKIPECHTQLFAGVMYNSVSSQSAYILYNMLHVSGMRKDSQQLADRSYGSSVLEVLGRGPCRSEESKPCESWSK